MLVTQVQEGGSSLSPAPTVPVSPGMLRDDCLSPFNHCAILNHPNITVGSGHQHDGNKDQEASLWEGQGHEVDQKHILQAVLSNQRLEEIRRNQRSHLDLDVLSHMVFLSSDKNW